MQQTYVRGDVNILSPVLTDPDEANSNGMCSTWASAAGERAAGIRK